VASALAVAVMVLAVTTGCGSAASPSSQSASPSATSSPSTAVATPRASPTAVATLAECDAPRSAQTLTVVHHFAVSPDDITVDQTGNLWVTARQANQLFNMTTSGTNITSQTVPGGIDGVTSDSTGIYVAQQDLNRIVAIAPGLPVVLHLPNDTPNPGIDGIFADVRENRLIVPDSPTGQLYSIAFPGSTSHLIASNLGRPVAATVVGDQIFVASETAPGLSVVSPNGTSHSLGSFSNLDEVVSYAGLLYVADLDHRDVVAVDPASGEMRPIAINLPAPQGLAVTSTGTLEIVDATTNELYSVPTCGPPT
jgi:sugar lactone lactonase YvrE